MIVKPLRSQFITYLKKHNLTKKFNKQLTILKINPRHPSLHTEALEPKSLKLHSFRIDQKYRVIFAVTKEGKVEVVDINDHYQ